MRWTRWRRRLKRRTEHHGNWEEVSWLDQGNNKFLAKRGGAPQPIHCRLRWVSSFSLGDLVRHGAQQSVVNVRKSSSYILSKVWYMNYCT
jgi:hypothetical protein